METREWSGIAFAVAFAFAFGTTKRGSDRYTRFSGHFASSCMLSLNTLKVLPLFSTRHALQSSSLLPSLAHFAMSWHTIFSSAWTSVYHSSYSKRVLTAPPFPSISLMTRHITLPLQSKRLENGKINYSISYYFVLCST